ncbi:MAG TPA: TetR family transcriptional regulator C-terminal domain-containing protein [Methylomirabilota bacterium]|nr:TetR family transcriptional regulator C-terminal domain-containing protein [Methylomirabilota bacterium]
MTPKIGVAPVRRGEIVRATIRCLAHEGYSGLTMKKVAREAGVSQGILHYYFKDKRAILIAALGQVMSDLNRRVIAAARGVREPRARLRSLISACLDVAATNREFWVVLVEFWGEMMHDGELAAINAGLYDRLRRVIGDIVTAGTKAGIFRRVNPLQAGAIILALVDGISLQLTFEPNAFTLSKANRFCEDAVLRYLGRER